MPDATTTPATTVAAPPAAPPTPPATPAAVAPATPVATPATPPATPQSWPHTWREDFASGDDKLLARLQRFVTPKDILTSYRALEQRVSSGELKAVTPFPEKGTPEQQAQWRKENGIAEKPEAYDLKFDDGTVVEETDKPWIDSFLKAAHAANVPTSYVREVIRWHGAWKDAQADAQEQADTDLARKTVDTMRAEWQGDYRPNMNSIQALLATAPKGVAEKLMGARFGDQTPIMSDPDVLRFLAGLSRKLNPMSTLVPASDEATMAKSVEDELAQIRETMRTNRKKYNSDDKMQERYRQLIDAQKRLTQKAA